MSDEPKAFRREIDLGDGSGKQVFEADTAEELANLLADAQANATKKIRELNAENKNLKRRVLTQPESGAADPDGPLPDFRGRALTPDEEFALGQRLQTPATSRAAIREAIEAEFGAPVETIRRTLRSAAETPRQLRGRDAAEAFLNNHPEFLTTQANSDQMFEYMTLKKMPLTTENFEIAFGKLSEAGLLQLRAPRDPGGAPGSKNGSGQGAGQPGAGDSANGAGAGGTRPRFASTTIASRNSGSPRGGTGPKMPTAEEIDKMSAAEHRRWISDPVHGAARQAHEERLFGAARR